ncbi:MAG TPA: dihydrolipoamide acetyltransferase family protein [Gaiellaceae bacterium]|nr:dihydrolipoamide acetyltransferase family protein [Gaiellaceae bacterium]
MAVEVKLPRLGQGMEAGTIVRWLKSEGDSVEKGEPLYELDTDKVTQEVESDTGGVLLKIVVTDGEVDVGTTIALIGAEGEDVSGLPGDGNGGRPKAADAESAVPVAPAPPADESKEAPAGEAPAGEAEASPAEADSLPVTPEWEGEPSAPPPRASPEPAAGARTARVKASPLARRMAREQGVDLARLTGTGPEGRIIAEDVERAAKAPRKEAAIAPSEFEVVELTSVRRTIARRLTEAWEAPVFQLTRTVDASELVATREAMVERLREGEAKPTVNDLLTRLVASALTRHRPLNSLFVDGTIHRYASVNVGIAVATPNGLVVPVIRNADRSSVQQIAATRADLVARARDGKLQLPDLEDGTFTISNLGMYGIDEFVAVLNPPQVAILAVGSIAERPLVIDGELDVAPTMTLTLTCDHRAIDGSEGAEFLQTLQELVEAPVLAL